MKFIILLFAVGIIAALAWYAGALLFKLKQQKRNVQTMTSQRMDTISESIRVIALAMEQQQCNLSEGCIRLYHLLEALPLKDKVNVWDEYTGIYSLYTEVKELPTHQARSQLSRDERKRQDKQREDKEALFEPQIMTDVANLKSFQPKL